jgi:hypothetical protein
MPATNRAIMHKVWIALTAVPLPKYSAGDRVSQSGWSVVRTTLSVPMLALIHVLCSAVGRVIVDDMYKSASPEHKTEQ